jgi:dihydrofolate reductase
MSKVVFSTTLSEPLSWANTQLVAQAPVEAVREMKDKGAKSMRTIGSLTLCRSLLKAGLADRFRVAVFPVITGSSGRERIYDDYPLRHEALCYRAGVRDLRRRAVAAA